MITREKTRKIKLGSIYIGQNNPISVQSMTTVSTENFQACIQQIQELTDYGCHIIRVAFPNIGAAKVLHKIKENIKIPLVADIHFDYKLALESIKQNVDGLRLNPGNLKRRDQIPNIVEEARKKSIPIRIGVNSGSIDFKKYSTVTPENLVSSALEHIEILENLNFFDIKISLKATDVSTTIKSYMLMAEKRNYPLHLGVTEAGTLFSGSVKSSVGIGALLSMGLGDTLRVSLAANPKEEVRLGKSILDSLHLLKEDRIEIIACPTCGRCEFDLITIANRLEQEIGHINKKIKIAIMGCIVNGPGESTNADIGIAGSKGGIGTLYRKGQKIKQVSEKEILGTLIEEVKNF